MDNGLDKNQEKLLDTGYITSLDDVLLSVNGTNNYKHNFGYQICIPMKPQPSFEDSTPTFYHWNDCQWTLDGLGFPNSAISEYSPLKEGQKIYINNGKSDIMYVKRITDIKVKPLLNSSDDILEWLWVMDLS